MLYHGWSFVQAEEWKIRTNGRPIIVGGHIKWLKQTKDTRGNSMNLRLLGNEEPSEKNHKHSHTNWT